MQIRYLNGTRLKRALIAAGSRLYAYRNHLNKINVFPVADGDTGTNMAGTLHALVQGIRRTPEDTLTTISQNAAVAALSGARGNSGTILAQFMYGLAEGIKGHTQIDTATFGRIVNQAVDYTYEALSDPVEGTILTVLRAWANTLGTISKKTEDFVQLFSESLEDAKQALMKTKSTLPTLRKAKVVDAGALGFVHMIEGIVHFIDHGRIRDIESASDLSLHEEPEFFEINEDLTFRYCTECIITGEEIDHAILRSELHTLGDSLIIAGSRKQTKLHIHTDDPEKVFLQAEQYGLLSEQKADDMHKQYTAAHTPHSEIALVVDSSCDLPAEIFDKDFVHMVPVKVLFGPRSYIDKTALSPEHYYHLMRTHIDEAATTSQPAPMDFEKQFSFLSQHYKSTVFLSLAEALSGTIDSARTALFRLSRKESVHIIDSKNVTVGSGLIARRLAEAIDQGKTISEIKELGEELVHRTRLLISIPNLEALLRSGRLSKAKGFLAQLLRLRPLLTLDPHGRVVKLTMIRNPEGGALKLLDILRKRLGEKAKTDFAIAHVDNHKTAEWIKTQLLHTFHPSREIFIQDASPALATHTGFGSLAVAYIEPDTSETT